MWRVGRVGLLLAWMGVISYWSDQPVLPIDQPAVQVALLGWQHKLAHLVAFGLLGLLARWTFHDLPRAWLVAIGLTSAFGALDEYHQLFTPGRSALVTDWLTDTLFGALAIGLRRAVVRRGWAPAWRRLAPAAVALLFAAGIGLAVRTGH